ncbi:MAG: type II secretion system F family protein [Kiritimatiellia bacterium]|jgi:type IV pilus assembly protein PilC
MQKFNYVALDAQGKEQKGVVEAKDQNEAITALRQHNLFPQSVAPVAKAAKAGQKSLGSKEINIKLPAFLRGRVKAKDLMVLTRQLATLVDSGLPLIRGLRILMKQTKNAQIKEALTGMSTAVEGGATFSEALAQYPKIFDHLYVNMAKAGEAGGVLEQSLTRLAEFLEKAEKIKNKVKSAMMYPIVVLCVALGITGFLMVAVIPRFEKVFADLLGEGKKMPELTQFVMNVSKTCADKDTMLPIIIAIAAIVVGVKLLNKTEKGRYAFDRLKLVIPGVGPLLLKSSIARSTRTLGTLMQSGVPVLQALDIVRDTSGNAVVAKAYQDIHESVKEGESMTPAMERSKIFPAMVVSMVDVGEETGALPTMLGRIANTYDDEVDNAVEAMTSIIEPIMIVFLALVVGTIVIAMFMPLTTIISGMSGN